MCRLLDCILISSIFLGVSSAGEPNCRHEHDYTVLQKLAELETRINQIYRDNEKSSCTAQCSNGWVAFGGHCYLFNDRAELTWDEAADFCSTHDAHLVTIQSQQEDIFLQKFAKRLFKGDSYKNRAMWIGATDLQTEGVWQWYTDGSLVRSGYTNWVPGEADRRSTPYRSQNCGCFWGNDGFTWHDHLCEGYKSFSICEK